MPSVVPDPRAIRPFASPEAFEAWLSKNHDRAAEVWIKIFKKGSGKPSIDASQAIDVCLCWGWIDGIRKGLDEEAFLQRYTPRTGKSRWSQINVERVQRLTKAGRMTPHGQVLIDAAKADGRWDAAYPPPSAIEMPADLLAAISKTKSNLEAFRALKKSETFSIAYRLHHLKSPERRAKLIGAFVESLAKKPTPVASNEARVAKKSAPVARKVPQKKVRP